MASTDELKALLGAPIPMARNTYLHFYNGGKLRGEFVGDVDPTDDYYSEEWFFSTNRAITPGRDNPPDKGFSRMTLPSGETVLLSALLEAFPDETLGSAHVARHGTKLGLLMKMFDVGEGAHIPVHWHPSPEFAAKHLGSPYGKNESWILAATRPGVEAWVGFTEDVGEKKFRRWMDEQDIAAMRAHMYRIEPKPGDVTFIRTGIVHSLGEGCCVLEPQEPSDWNILAEWEGYPYGKEDAHCGVGWDLALTAAEFTKLDKDYLYDYILRKPTVDRTEDGNEQVEYLPDEARPYFWHNRYRVRTTMKTEPTHGYVGLIAHYGRGAVRGPWGDVAFRRGQGVFVPRCLAQDGFELVNNGDDMFEVICSYPPVSST
jgi:mannose-6-phosphate isomerase